MSSSKRHFTVIINSKEHGLYVSLTPSSAAKKAVSKLCADNKNKKVKFSIRETTRYSNKKIYGPYIGYMQKLEGCVIRYKPIAKLIKKNRRMKGGKFFAKGARAIIFHPAINTKNPNYISKLIYYDYNSEAKKLLEIERKLNELDKENKYHVPFVSIRKIITKKEINKIQYETIREHYNRWFEYHENNLNTIKKLVNKENFNNMTGSKFLFNYLITYKYGGMPVINLINTYTDISNYNWIILGIINIFDGILYFYSHGINNCNIHVDNILFSEDNSSNWRMINFKINQGSEKESNLIIDINNLLEILNEMIEYCTNISNGNSKKFTEIDLITDETFAQIRTKMLALLKKEE